MGKVWNRRELIKDTVNKEVELKCDDSDDCGQSVSFSHIGGKADQNQSRDRSIVAKLNRSCSVWFISRKVDLNRGMRVEGGIPAQIFFSASHTNKALQ